MANKSKNNAKTGINNKVNNTNKTNKNTQIMSKFIIAKVIPFLTIPSVSLVKSLFMMP